MRLSTVLMCLFAFSANAFEAPTGEYLLEGGSGWLRIGGKRAGGLAFEIESVGANGHSCALDGVIKGAQAELEAEPDAPCIVKFSASGGASRIAVSSNEACRYYCGMRATFDGSYLKPLPACEPKRFDATRASFLKLYKAGNFVQARATLEPLLQQCDPVMGWITQADLRNDLAVTLHKLKDFAACRVTLAPLAELAAMSDADIDDNYPPADAPEYLRVAKASRFNLKLCDAAAVR